MSLFQQISLAHESLPAKLAAEQTQQRRQTNDLQATAFEAFNRCKLEVLQPGIEAEVKTILAMDYTAGTNFSASAVTMIFVPFKSHRQSNAGNTCRLVLEHRPGKWGIKWSYVIEGTPANKHGYAGAVDVQDLTTAWLAERCGDFYEKAFDFATLKTPFFELVARRDYNETQFEDYLIARHQQQLKA
jgi:hypothetical protein